MKHKKLLSICAILFFALFPFCEVLACECDFPDICEAYSRAKKVFIGKLEKIVEDKKAKFYTVEAHFSVEKTYKGLTEKVEIVTFKLGECLWIDFKEGKKYFVYAEDSNINTYCNRTSFLKNVSPDLEYAKSLSDLKPIFSIKGHFPISKDKTENELKDIKLFVKIGRLKKRVEIDKKGFFNLIVRKKGNYEVVILFPFKADVAVTRGLSRIALPARISSSTSSTKVQYDLPFKPNECDFRLIDFVKID